MMAKSLQNTMFPYIDLTAKNDVYINKQLLATLPRIDHLVVSGADQRPEVAISHTSCISLQEVVSCVTWLRLMRMSEFS